MSKHANGLPIGVALLCAALVAGCAVQTAGPSPIPPAPSPTELPATSTPTELPPTETAEPAPEPEFELVSDVPYTSSQTVDIYSPTGSGPWPVVLILHGAGGDKSFYAPGGEGLANRGAVVFIANWRSEPWVHGEMAMMEDTACAVRFARSSAADYGGDPSRVAVLAHSIAGWSAAMIALAGDEFAGDCAVEGVSAVPDVLIGLNGAYDAGESNPDGGASYLKDEDPELWERIYPYVHIGKNLDVRFELIAGDLSPHDVEVAERFLDALQEAGYEAQLVIIEGMGHGAASPGTPEFKLLLDTILAAASG